MSTLLLHLAAPLQAWGTDSKFETRRTGREPSKSGVVGMLAAAIGLPRDGDLSLLHHLRMGVRVEREGKLLRDFHTAHSSKTSYITYRYYLADAEFLVGLESPNAAFLEELGQALKHPAFPLFLGRRSCPPSKPLLLGLRETNLEQSLKQEPWRVSEWRRRPEKIRLRLLLECPASETGGETIRDVPLSFSPAGRNYAFRALHESYVELGPQGLAMSEHDPMSEL